MADFNLPAGLNGEKSELVTVSNTAKAYGSGSVDVYATPAMIGLMEGACLSVVDPLLPQGFATVGVQLHVAHLAATALEQTVTAKAELITISGRKLVFNVTAFDQRQKIGEGTHERFIVELEKFLAKTQTG